MPEPPKQPVDIPFPISGIVEGSSHTQQPLNTTWDAKNVVPFDPEEDRARGGRRNGVEKVTNLPVSSGRLQMVKSVGVVPGDANMRVAGGISSFSDSQTMSNREGFLRYGSLPDGAQLNLTNLGHKYYGSCFKRLNAGENGPGDNNWTLGMSSSRQGAVGAANSLTNGHNAHSSNYAATLNAWRDEFANGHSGVTKQTDENGFPYISVLPCMFPVNTGGTNAHSASPNEPRTWWETNGDGESFYRQYGTRTLCVNNCMTLMPDVISDEHPWDSSSEREFVSRVEFMFPKTHAKTESAQDAITFVSSAADASTDDKIYDPWYTEVVNNGGHSELDKYFPYGGTNQAESKSRFGFCFRLGASFDSTPQSSDEWLDNIVNPTESALLAVYFDREYHPTDNGQWRLKVAQTTRQDGITKSTFDVVDSIVASTISLGTEEEQVDPSEYHTLEVRVIKNKMEVLFDGSSVFSRDDITDQLDHLDDSGNRKNSMFFYEMNHCLTGVYNSSAIGVTEPIRRKQLAYWATRDWNARKVDGVSAASNDSKYDGSDELRVRSWTWHEVGGLVSVPQNTIVSSGGFIYGAPNQTNFARISTKQDLNADQNMVNAVEYFQKMYFVDGDNYKVYEPAESSATGHAGTISDWNATNGDLPGGDGSTGVNGSGASDGNARCPIIATWLGRIVLAGKGDDPQNWFMSAVGDPLDWDYIDGDSETGAVKGSSTRQFGEMASAITALIPSSGTKLLIGGINSLHMLTGDPLWPDTQQRALSWDVGIVGPEAWCYGPGNSVYFMGENGLYLLSPNDFDVSQTDRLSAGKFDNTFGGVDFDSSTTMLAYDHEKHGVHIFVTPNRQKTDPIEHFYYDRRSNSFWKMEYPAVIGPTAVYDFKSQSPGSRRILLGGFDGHIRSFSDTAKTDDGTAIDSYLWLGPIQTSSTREAKLTKLIAVLDRESADVEYSIHVADSVEEAKQSEAVHNSTWSSGRNAAHLLRARGSAIFIKLYNNSSNLPWVYERLTAVLAVAGKVRDR